VQSDDARLLVDATGVGKPVLGILRDIGLSGRRLDHRRHRRSGAFRDGCGSSSTSRSVRPRRSPGACCACLASGWPFPTTPRCPGVVAGLPVANLALCG
jgi:hypothetical protein